MTARTLLCWAYALLALVALVTTYSQFLPFPPGGFQGFWAELKVNPVSRGIAIDLGFFVLAAALFMTSEARRLKIRFVWLYLFLGYMFDISVIFPIFLIARERALARAGGPSVTFKGLDFVAAALVTAVIAWQVWFLLQ